MILNFLLISFIAQIGYGVYLQLWYYLFPGWSKEFIRRLSLKEKRSILDFVKMTLVLCLLFPSRFLVMLTGELLGFFASRICLFGIREGQLLGKWRESVLSVVFPITARSILWGAGFLYIHRVGTPEHTTRAPIVVAPHVSLTDGFILSCFVPLMTYVMKSELMEVPVFGTMFRAAQAIFVNRAERQSRCATALAISRRVLDIQTEATGTQLVVFPEGTTTDGLAVYGFRTGAFRPGVTVQPAAVRYPCRNFDPVWTGLADTAGLALLELCLQPVNFAEVEFFPSYTPADNEKEDPVKYAANVRQLLGTSLGLPISDELYAVSPPQKKEL
eukprot:Rmarinus@m.23929